MRAVRGFRQVEHGRHAPVHALERGRPLVAGAGQEGAGEHLPHPRPCLPVLLRRHVVQAEDRDELSEEFRLERADGDIPAVRALVGAVERRPAVQQVRAALVAPQPAGVLAVHHRHQVGRPVDHGGVDHLPAPAPLPFEQCGEDPRDEEHRAAAEVGDQVERRHRRAAGRADARQRPGDGQVVDVVPGAGREWPGLSPAGHPGVDERRVALRAGLWPDAKPLGDTRAERLDQDVRALDHAQHGLGARRGAEVNRERGTAPVQHLRSRRCEDLPAGALDARHVGTEVGQQHARELDRADAGEFDDPDPGQWPAHRRASNVSVISGHLYI